MITYENPIACVFTALTSTTNKTISNYIKAFVICFLFTSGTIRFYRHRRFKKCLSKVPLKAKVILAIQGIHKRMVRFQKLMRNLFLTLHGHNVHRQQRKLSKFLMRYQQFASNA